MREQLRLLEDLQQHDARLLELDAIRTSLPKKIAAAHAAITELERLLELERAELADNETFRRDQETGQKDTEAMLQKSKARLTQVRNMKESQAAQKEMDSAKRQLETREEEVARLATALGEQRKKIAHQEEQLRAEQAELQVQEGEVHKRLADIEVQIAQARVARNEAAGRIRPDVLKRYGTIRLKRGLAVVPAKDGTCCGCNMNIPPQLYNILQRGTTLEHCPNCNRIIYWDKPTSDTGKGKDPDKQGKQGKESRPSS